MLNDTIPELLYNGIGQGISNLFFTFGEQELTIFEKSQDEITTENIDSVYAPATKKIRTIDFYYDGDLELQNSSPITLRAGIGTKDFPFTGKDLSQTVGSFFYCLDNALQQSCPDTMLRIFCRGKLGSMYGFSAILCPWPDDKDSTITLDSNSTFKIIGDSKTASIYIVDANIKIDYQDSSDSSGCKIYANGCHIDTTESNDKSITLSNWSFFNSSVNLSQSKVSLLSGAFCVNSSLSLKDNYNHNAGSLNYDFSKDCIFDFLISATYPDKTLIKINYALNSNFTAEALETYGELWVDCLLNSTSNLTSSTWYGYGACGAKTAINCAATVYTDSSCQVFRVSTDRQKCINCTAYLHITGDIKQDIDARLFYNAEVTDCRANVIIDCNLIDSELEIHGYYLGSSMSLINSTAVCDVKIKAVSTTYGREYYSGAGIYFFAVSTYSSEYSIAGLSSNHSINLVYSTPGNSSSDIWGVCRFFYNYAKIKDNSFAPKYIESECKIYEFSNSPSAAWPTIMETCIW